MKIKEGVLKEHLYNCVFELSESQTFGQVKEVLEMLGLRNTGAAPQLTRKEGYVLVRAHRLDGEPVFEWFPSLTHTYRTLTLSEISEDESPKYVKCIDSAHGIVVRKGVIYRVTGERNKYYSVDLGEIGTGEFLKFRFTPATEKAYIGQQSNIEQEEALKPAPTKDPLEETVEELKKAGLYLISEEQISVLADINGTVKAQLKEFLPYAFKTEEETYRLWQWFRLEGTCNDYMLGTDGTGLSITSLYLVDVHEGRLFTCLKLKVKDCQKITKGEIQEWMDDFFELFEKI